MVYIFVNYFTKILGIYYINYYKIIYIVVFIISLNLKKYLLNEKLINKFKLLLT